MNSTQIMYAANPVPDDAYADAWSDAEGRAAFEQIVAEDRPAAAPRRGRVIRRRLVVGAALAAAAGTAVAVVGLPGTPHGGAPSAWSVTKNADGSLTVRVSDYRDLDGLQSRLRAAGLRANIRTLPAGQCTTPLFKPDKPPLRAGIWFSFDNSISSMDFSRLVLSRVYFPSLHLGAPGEAENLGSDRLPHNIFFPILWPGISLTFDPRYLPSADTVWIGFPAQHSDVAGNVARINVANTRSGAPDCFNR
jgi:hypothetical protein